jgi:hypothetical protein
MDYIIDPIMQYFVENSVTDEWSWKVMLFKVASSAKKKIEI